MERLQMAEEPDDNDAEFLAYLERLGDTWLSSKLEKLLQEKLKSNPLASGQSENYLERQNQMLLERLLKLEKSVPSGNGALSGEEIIEPALGAPPPPKGAKPSPTTPPTKKAPFWK
jgi:hypothetical protein